MTKLIAALAFLAINFYTYHFLASETVIPPRKSFAEFPLELGGWRCDGPIEMEPAVERNLGVTEYLLCDFRRRPGELVNAYVGYHQTQIREEGGGANEDSIHPPAHCMPGSGWDIIDNRMVKLDLPGLPEPDALGRRLIIAKGNARQLVYYWYHSRGRVIAEDWKKILYLGLDRATRGRTDGALARFTVSIRHDDEESAEAILRDLAGHVVMQLPSYVPE